MKYSLRPSAAQHSVKSFAALGLATLLTLTGLMGAAPYLEGTASAADIEVCSSCSETSLQSAVTAANPGDTINITSNLTTGAQVTITKAITINGNGYTVSPTFTKDSNSNNSVFGIHNTSAVTIQNLVIDGSGGTSLHGVNVYKSTSVLLQNMTIKYNDHSGIVVNGSEVTVNGLVSEGNGWHGINVDQGSGVTEPATLTVTGTNTHANETALYIDEPSNSDISVNDNTDQYRTNGDGVYTSTANVPTCSSTTSSFDTFATGSVDAQNGWESTGGYDQAIVHNVYEYAELGCKSLRISNSVTSGNFGNQTFSYSTANEAGETESTNGGKSGGTRVNHYEAVFSFATASDSYQPDMFLSVSPDRGDGSRMSYLSLTDTPAGVVVTFYDVQGTGSPANFVPTTLATLNHGEVYNLKFVIDFVDGPSNDIVKIYIDGALVHTGTTWENYYRYDTEANAEQTPRTVDSLIFRASGAPQASNDGAGYLFDNVMISTTAPSQGGTGGGNSGNDDSSSNGGSNANDSPTFTVTSGTQTAGQASGSANTTTSEPTVDETVAQVLGTESGIAANNTNETPAENNSNQNQNDDQSLSRFLGLGWWWILVLSGVGLLAYYWFVVRKADQA